MKYIKQILISLAIATIIISSGCATTNDEFDSNPEYVTQITVD